MSGWAGSLGHTLVTSSVCRMHLHSPTWASEVKAERGGTPCLPGGDDHWCRLPAFTAVTAGRSRLGFCAVQEHLEWGQTCCREGNQTQPSLRHLQVSEWFLYLLAAGTWMEVELSQPSSAGKPSRELGENHHRLLALRWI